MSSPQGVNHGVFHAGHSSCGGGPYPKAMASILERGNSMVLMNQVLVITSPDEVRKKAPFLSPLSSMKWRIAAIGHSSSPVTHLSQNRTDGT